MDRNTVAKWLVWECWNDGSRIRRYEGSLAQIAQDPNGRYGFEPGDIYPAPNDIEPGVWDMGDDSFLLDTPENVAKLVKDWWLYQVDDMYGNEEPKPYEVHEMMVFTFDPDRDYDIWVEADKEFQRRWPGWNVHGE